MSTESCKLLNTYNQFLFLIIPYAELLWIKSNTEGGLTILTPIRLQSESNPPSGVPVQRNEPEEAGYHWLFQFVLDHSVSIVVAWKSLELHNNMLV